MATRSCLSVVGRTDLVRNSTFPAHASFGVLRRASLLVALTAAFSSAPASAEEASATNASPAERRQIEEVVVTAERKEASISEVWQLPYGGSDKTVDVHLSWLRRKLGETGAEPRLLQTVRGVGVRLAEPGP